ncbi:MAG: hypothetical protein DWQ08_05825 [Proteobacteria bacterium]|nr:MAG: hypothetical protein DWQ08_05825 [Pseudomonadota bacterium]
MKKSPIALAVAAAIAAPLAADAATHTLKLTGVISTSANGNSTANLDADGGDWTYDDALQTVAAGGLFTARYNINPATKLFTHDITDYVIDATGAGIAAASTYVCTEGTFGGIVGAHLCGNYNFGGNYLNDSTLTYGPGITVSRTIGGDDGVIGPPQSIAQNDGFRVDSWDGRTLVVENVVPATSGYTYTFVKPADAVDDVGNIPQGTATVDFPIGANDLRWFDEATVVEETAGNQGGSFTINGSGGTGSPGNVTVTYVPPSPAFTGTETWVYRVTDTMGPLSGQTDTATLTVNVSPLGATDDSAATTRLRAPVVIPVGNNDFGFTDPSSVAVTVAPTLGTTSITGNGGPVADITITYTSTAPLGSAAYQDTFTYQVTDNNSASDTAVVTVQVNNALPVAGDLAGITLDTQGVSPAAATTTVNVGAGGAIAGNVVGDALAVVTTTPSNDVTSTVVGTTITIAASTFTSAGDAVGYTITDADGEAATGTISLSIPDVAPTLTAASQTISAPAATTISLPFSAGNGAASDHSVSVSTPQFGTVANPTVNGTAGTVDFTYTPDGFAGPDVLTVNLTDGDGSVASATATITMTGPAVTIPTQDSLPGSSAIAPAGLLSLLAGLPLLRSRRRRRD